MYEVKVTSGAGKVLKKWKKSNPSLYKKYEKIVHELADHPRTGLGHPEPLIGGKDITYLVISQRVTVLYMTSTMTYWLCWSSK